MAQPVGIDRDQPRLARLRDIGAMGIFGVQQLIAMGRGQQRLEYLPRLRRKGLRERLRHGQVLGEHGPDLRDRIVIVELRQRPEDIFLVAVMQIDRRPRHACAARYVLHRGPAEPIAGESLERGLEDRFLARILRGGCVCLRLHPDRVTESIHFVNFPD